MSFTFGMSLKDLLISLINWGLISIYAGLKYLNLTDGSVFLEAMPLLRKTQEAAQHIFKKITMLISMSPR